MSDDLLQDDVSEEVVPHERQSTGESEEYLREPSAEQSSCRPEKAWCKQSLRILRNMEIIT